MRLRAVGLYVFLNREGAPIQSAGATGQAKYAKDATLLTPA